MNRSQVVEFNQQHLIITQLEFDLTAVQYFDF
jgi:hypothetical protein